MSDVAPAAADTVAALAARLVCSAGRRAPIAINPMTGGGNNRLLRLTMADGDDLVLKCYFTSPHDPRDRLGAEWEFLSYAWSRGVRSVPEPLRFDRAARAALYRFMPGRRPAASEVDADLIDAAAAFVLELNRPPRTRNAVRSASEACFSLAQHLSRVDRRIERLATLDPDAPCRERAEQFIAHKLRPQWVRVRERIARDGLALGLNLDEPLRDNEICLSPSDFGFHNALIDGAGGVVFTDFEYAGRDDPAKLICDFFCQPEIPAPIAYYQRFAARIVEGLELPRSHADRCQALLDAYRIKWVCIILNDFLPVGAARRAFADAGARAERCAVQLAKADEKLAQLSRS